MSLSVRLTHALPGFTLDVAFDAPPGITVLFGPSGAGKTTVSHAVAGLIRPDAGRIVLDDRVLFDSATRHALPPHRRALGCVFQEGRLFPHLNVRANLLYGQRFVPRTERVPPLDQITGLLGIDHLLDRRPGSLSGGEKQRVAIGRALLCGPRMLIADEPLAALDAARKAEILPYFERLRDDLRIPILYVSHAPAEVARLATTVIALKDGRVTSQGSAARILSALDLDDDPRALGSVLNATVRMHHDDGLTEVSAGGLGLFLPRLSTPPGRAVRLRIPAQDVILSLSPPENLSALNILPGQISRVEIRSCDQLVTLDTAAGQVLAKLSHRSAQAMQLAVGTRCHAIVKAMALC